MNYFLNRCSFSPIFSCKTHFYENLCLTHYFWVYTIFFLKHIHQQMTIQLIMLRNLRKRSDIAWVYDSLASTTKYRLFFGIANAFPIFFRSADCFFLLISKFSWLRHWLSFGHGDRAYRCFEYINQNYFNTLAFLTLCCSFSFFLHLFRWQHQRTFPYHGLISERGWNTSKVSKRRWT